MSGNDESSENPPAVGEAGGGRGGTMIDLTNFFGLFKNGLTEQNLVLLIGIMVALIFVIVISIGVKVFCCQDKRKFRSSKDVKCVRHQESMTSPLDSPLRSVISMTANNANLSEQQQHLQQQREQQQQLQQQHSEQSEHLINSRPQVPSESGIEMQKFATLPTPSVRSGVAKSGSNHENENGRILRGSVDVPPPSVWKTSSAMNVNANSPTKPQRARKRSESSITSNSGQIVGRQTLKAQVHDGDEKAPKGNIAEVTINHPNIAVQLNEEMKSKLSAIKDPGKSSTTNQRPPIKPPITSSSATSNNESDPRLPHHKSYSTTSNALTSSEVTTNPNAPNSVNAQPKSNPLPRMWFVSLDNITPEPVYRGQV